MKPKRLTPWITLSWIPTAALLSLQPAVAQKAPSRSLESFKQDLPRSFEEYMQRSEGAAAKRLRAFQEDFQQDAPARFSNLEVQQPLQDAAANFQAQQRSQVKNIDAAVAKFRAQQQQRFQGQSQLLLPGAPAQGGSAPIP